MPKKIDSAQPNCPISSKSLSEKYWPFSSKQCADIDLGRWLKGVYATPSVDQTLPEEDIDQDK
jgi:endogenous inhibitor of DNA gyrase (YacG/DUF329 family)